MTLIRVNPESIRAYATHAQAIFDGVTESLHRLTRDVVDVRYFGPNAVAFGTECGRMAVEFGSKLHHDLAAMADAVRRSTSSIAASLGGQPITITLTSRPVTAPAPTVVDYVDVDTEALEALVPAVGAHFASIRDALASHLAHLEQTDWEGIAKLAVVDAVAGFTTSARHGCDQAEQALGAHIRHQIQSVLAADR